MNFISYVCARLLLNPILCPKKFAQWKPPSNPAPSKSSHLPASPHQHDPAKTLAHRAQPVPLRQLARQCRI